MRRLYLLIPNAIAIGTLAILIGWSASRPPAPDVVPRGNAVDLSFEVSGADRDEIELGLERGARGDLFIRFGIERNGAGVVAVLKDAGRRRSLAASGDGDNLPDWPFLKGRGGERVVSFSFRNQLVELEDGGMAVRMVYTGRDVPLLRALRLDRPATLPPFIGRALGHDGPVRLEPGTYPIDAETGVTLRAEPLGR